MSLPAADDHLLRQSAGLLGELVACHGISSIQLGTDATELVVTVEERPTYFDVAEFEATTDFACAEGRLFRRGDCSDLSVSGPGG